MTRLASDGPNFVLPLLRCALIATSRSLVRPSCRKNTRLPRPHSGAVRNSSPRAAPCRSDAPVVAVSIGAPADAQAALGRGVRGQVGRDRAVGDALDQS